MEGQPQGSLILQVRENLDSSWIGVTAGPFLVLVALFLPAGVMGVALRLFVLLFGLFVAGMGIRGMKNRPVLLELFEQGMMIHAKAGGVFVSRSLLHDLFVPWHCIESMQYLDAKQTTAAGIEWLGIEWGARNPLIVVKMRMDSLWPPHGTLRSDVRSDLFTRSMKPGEIYLQTYMCSPRNLDLWEQIRPIAASHGAEVAP